VPFSQAATNDVPAESAAVEASASEKGWKNAWYLKVAPGSIAGLAHRPRNGESR
jgi:hypothetical protein